MRLTGPGAQQWIDELSREGSWMIREAGAIAEGCAAKGCGRIASGSGVSGKPVKSWARAGFRSV